MSINESNLRYINPNETDSRFDYKCGHCGKETSGRVVAKYNNVMFLLCTSCALGSIWIYPDRIIPGSKPGSKLEGLPPEIEEAYNEARNCLSIEAYVASELICRKILMHIAVDKGAEEGKSFEFYLDYLEEQKYITPPIKKWADIIRRRGNTSAHKIENPGKAKAENTLMFTMELLRIIYEMDYIAKKYITPQ